MQRNVFSVVVLCYKHFEYVKQAISSVLSQDYASVELIVSDDGSANFPKSEIESFIQENQGTNITRVLVRQEEHNVGTVKHLNHVKEYCTGEYIAFLAGDDVFASNQVLSKYVEGFEDAPENCYIQMAQTGMYNETLEHLESYYLKPFVAEALMHTTEQTDELMHCLLLYGACLPSTSTCFRALFFRRFGKFDEEFRLVEDYPMHIRLAEEGWIIHYHNFVAIKHRHGGISHGQSAVSTTSSNLYFSDMRRLMAISLEKSHLVSTKERKIIKNKYARDILWIDFQIAKSTKDVSKLAALVLRHPCIALRKCMSKAYALYDGMQRNLLKICLLSWIIMPQSIEMFSKVTHLNTSGLTQALFGVSWALFGLWLISWVVWIIFSIIYKNEQFPGGISYID